MTPLSPSWLPGQSAAGSHSAGSGQEGHCYGPSWGRWKGQDVAGQSESLGAEADIMTVIHSEALACYTQL